MPCVIETTKRFRQQIGDRRAEVARTLQAVSDGFGQPHLHSGLGLRKLAAGVFECRTDLKLRLVFRARKGVLIFDFAGNHDAVRAYLRRL